MWSCFWGQLYINAFGRVRTGELLRTTQSQKAQKWQGKERALANTIEALDIRIVEIPPQIITKLIYGYGWQPLLSGDDKTVNLVNDYLRAEGIDYNTTKSIHQNLRQQLEATNLFKIITGEQTQSHSTPKYHGITSATKKEQERQTKETAELAVTRLACELSSKNQHQFHGMLAKALDDLLENSHHITSVANFKAVYAEPSCTVTGANGEQQKVIRPDIVIDMQDKFFFLEFCWRSEEHFTYGDVANYVLRKVNESYLNLPLIRAIQEG